MFRTIVLTLAAAAIGPSAAPAQSVDEILAKHIEARRGMAKMKAIDTMRLTARMTVGPGLEAPVVIEGKRPNSMRMEFTIQGLTAVQAYDGTTGWMIMPFQGKLDPEALPDEELKEVAEQADFDGPLVDAKQKGHTVELAGKEDVEGTPTYKLKVTLKSGGVRYMYLDADSFLTIKEEATRTIRGTERETESILGDYKAVDGLMLPHSIESSPKGSPEKQKITIEKVDLNPAIDDSRFKMPTPARPGASQS